MFKRQTPLIALEDRGPLRIMFLITSMPVGGAETLLVNLIRRMNRDHFAPEICCLKELGPLGEEMALEVPVHSEMLSSKYDLRILGRLTKLFRKRNIDGVVTVGAGDKMFWGRLAARRAQLPVILSALHSTGWPDGVGKLNRLLTPITDGFIAVAKEHGRYLIQQEGFPIEKVRVISNGIDGLKFCPRNDARHQLREMLDIPLDAPVCGIIAAIRPEKNHELFLSTAALIRQQLPQAHFIIVGDGPQRELLEIKSRSMNLDRAVHFLGTRSDIPELLAMLDLFLLTSHIEANPVSILEAMSVGLPIVSTRVGSIAESVEHTVTGYLAEPGDAKQLAEYSTRILSDQSLGQQMGAAGREVVDKHWSLESMVAGYQQLITDVYQRKASGWKEVSVPSEETGQRNQPLEIP